MDRIIYDRLTSELLAGNYKRGKHITPRDIGRMLDIPKPALRLACALSAQDRAFLRARVRQSMSPAPGSREHSTPRSDDKGFGVVSFASGPARISLVYERAF